MKNSRLNKVSTSKNIPYFDALIIGAGFSGLYQLYSLKKQGLSVKVIEAGSGVGGTWYWNRYPGARCDSESFTYSYTFSKELFKEWEWTERYPGHAEVVKYLNYVADKFCLKKDIYFEKKVISAHYNNNKWKVKTDSLEEFESKYLITAVGCLSSKNIPNFNGSDSFLGESYHTSDWPHYEVDFTNKRVGQIGTGSTGIQTAPEIAKKSKHLTIFQRSANYSVPASNYPLSPEFKKYIKENYEEIKHAIQSNTNGHFFKFSKQKILETSIEEREKIFEKAWLKGGLGFRACFNDIAFNKEANDLASDFIKRKIHKIVKDPKKAKILTDIDHAFASKRPPIDTNYFETFNKDNVTLIDLKSSPIESITSKGVKTIDKEYELDILVYATGFDAMTGPLLNIDIRGCDGIKLKDVWSEGPKTFLGIQISGFPNLFTITGPGSPSVLCNMIVPIEQHVEWINDCIVYMEKNQIDFIEATQGSMENWTKHVEDVANETLFIHAKKSWYYGANIPGKPRGFMPYPGGMSRYKAICNFVANQNYLGFKFSNSNEEETFVPSEISIDILIKDLMTK